MQLPAGIDGFTLSLWLLRLAFLALVYVFLGLVARMLWRDVRQAARAGPREVGRLVVVASVEGGPPPGTVYPIDAVTSFGRDINNTIAIDDPFVSADHAVLTYRGRAWYLEDRGSTNGSFVNGERVAEPLPLGFGDEIQVGRVRFRLDRPRVGSTAP